MWANSRTEKSLAMMGHASMRISLRCKTYDTRMSLSSCLSHTFLQLTICNVLVHACTHISLAAMDGGRNWQVKYVNGSWGFNPACMQIWFWFLDVDPQTTITLSRILADQASFNRESTIIPTRRRHRNRGLKKDHLIFIKLINSAYRECFVEFEQCAKTMNN